MDEKTKQVILISDRLKEIENERTTVCFLLWVFLGLLFSSLADSNYVGAWFLAFSTAAIYGFVLHRRKEKNNLEKLKKEYLNLK